MDKLNLELLLSITKTLKILYVEDNEDARVQTLKMLHNYFSHIDIAVNGADGLELFQKNCYNIIFTDLNMPVMDGISMIEKIRQIDIHIPIVVLSAYDDKEYFLETIKHGIDGYILKPYNFKQIIEVITKMILKLDIEVKNSNTIKLDFDFIWDKQSEQLLQNNQVFKLTANETKLIKLFIKNDNQTLSSQDIEIELFSQKMKENTKLRNLISRLKTKLGVNLIESNYGLGYILRKG